MHIVYPENRMVDEETVITWAWDSMVNAAYKALPESEQQAEDAIEHLSATIGRPTLEEAVSALEDAGEVTFTR